MPINFNPAYPFHENAQKHPENIALWVDGVSYSYSELREKVRRIAEWLRPKTDAAVKRVCILSNRSVGSYLGILGTCWAGASYVPLNPTFPEKRLLKIITQAQPDALIVDKESLSLLTPEIIKAFPNRILLITGNTITIHGTLIDGIDRLPAGKNSVVPAEVGPTSEAYLVFTSGTTGEPNGVAITAGNLAFAIKTLLASYTFTPDDRFSQFFELSFDFSVMDLFVPWQVGASTHVVPASQKLGPGRFIMDQQLSVWTCVPSMISNMERMNMLRPGIFPSLRFSCFSGETLTTAAARTWQHATPNGIIVNLYGQTEAPIGSLVQTFGPDTPLTEETGSVALGKPLVDTCVAVVGRDGSFVPPGTIGELALAGPHVAAGYLNNPERTKEKFQVMTHPLYGSRTWYLSGDLARQDADSTFHFLGRTDNEIKISGHRIMLEEVELYLRENTGHSTVAVVHMKDQLGVAETLIGFVVGDKIDEPEIKKAMLQDLPRPLVPRRIFAVNDMPLSKNGKVDRQELLRIARMKAVI